MFEDIYRCLANQWQALQAHNRRGQQLFPREIYWAREIGFAVLARQERDPSVAPIGNFFDRPAVERFELRPARIVLVGPSPMHSPPRRRYTRSAARMA